MRYQVVQITDVDAAGAILTSYGILRLIDQKIVKRGLTQAVAQAAVNNLNNAGLFQSDVV